MNYDLFYEALKRRPLHEIKACMHRVVGLVRSLKGTDQLEDLESAFHTEEKVILNAHKVKPELDRLSLSESRWIQQAVYSKFGSQFIDKISSQDLAVATAPLFTKREVIKFVTSMNQANKTSSASIASNAVRFLSPGSYHHTNLPASWSGEKRVAPAINTAAPRSASVSTIKKTDSNRAVDTRRRPPYSPLTPPRTPPSPSPLGGNSYRSPAAPTIITTPTTTRTTVTTTTTRTSSPTRVHIKDRHNTHRDDRAFMHAPLRPAHKASSPSLTTGTTSHNTTRRKSSRSPTKNPRSSTSTSITPDSSALLQPYPRNLEYRTFVHPAAVHRDLQHHSHHSSPTRYKHHDAGTSMRPSGGGRRHKLSESASETLRDLQSECDEDYTVYSDSSCSDYSDYNDDYGGYYSDSSSYSGSHSDCSGSGSDTSTASLATIVYTALQREALCRAIFGTDTPPQVLPPLSPPPRYWH